MKIIVVDDEINALHSFLDQIITQDDVEYKFFKDDLFPLINYCQNNDINGAFLDVRMGKISGIELARKIAHISSLTKIVFITGTNMKMEDVPDDIKDSVIGIIYKPVDILKLERYILEMKNKKSVLEVKMFNGFDCFINHHLVRFSSSKAKELFAFVLANDGKSVSMEQAITALWPDKPLDKAKISYRDAVWRLRQTLNEIDFPCIDFARALLILNKENIECDYYDVINHKKEYNGDNFLPSYEWSLDYENSLNN